jgi:hypothetical protein
MSAVTEDEHRAALGRGLALRRAWESKGVVEDFPHGQQLDDPPRPRDFDELSQVVERRALLFGVAGVAERKRPPLPLRSSPFFGIGRRIRGK